MKKIFFIFIFISFYSSAKAQATLTFEKAIRPLASGLTNSEGNTIVRDAFQLPTGLAFSNDGKKVFSSNFTSNGDHECISMMTLGTPFDLRTVSLVVDEASPLVEKVGLTDNSVDTKCTDIKFSRDGLKMFLGNLNGKIHGFDLTTPFNLNGLTYSNNVTGDLTDNKNGGGANFSFSNDGKKLIFLDGTQEAQHIDEYSLSTAYDLTSINLVNTITLTTTANLDSKDQAHGIEFSQDGMTMFVLMHDGNAVMQTDKDAIFQFRLTQSFSTSTATMVGSVTPSGTLNTAAFGMAFSPTGNKLYLVNRVGSQDVDKYVAGGSVDVVTQVGLSCDYGLVACVSDPITSISTQVQLAKNNISENSSIIFKRFEWIKRNRHKSNFNNLNASISSNNTLLNYWIDKVQDKAVVQKTSLKDSNNNKSSWSYWSHGDVSLGSYHGKLDEFGINIEKPKDIHTKGITFGADLKNDKNNFTGYAIRYSDGKSRFANSGHGTTMDTLSLNYYFITPLNDRGYTNTVIGLSSLQYDLETGAIETGQRNGNQLYLTTDIRNDIEYSRLNLTPSLKLKYAFTELSEFTEFMTNTSSAGTNVTYGKETFFTGDVATGILFNSDPLKVSTNFLNKTVSHNGGLEFVYDYSPDVTFEYSYASTSDIYYYKLANYSNKNIRVNYGYEELYDNNFTLSFNYERLQHLDTEKFSHTDSFFLKLGRIQQEDYEFALSLDALQDYKVRSHYLAKLGEYDLKVGSNYNFISEIPEYGAMIEISKKH